MPKEVGILLVLGQVTSPPVAEYPRTESSYLRRVPVLRLRCVSKFVNACDDDTPGVELGASQIYLDLRMALHR